MDIGGTAFKKKRESSAVSRSGEAAITFPFAGRTPGDPGEVVSNRGEKEGSDALR